MFNEEFKNDNDKKESEKSKNESLVVFEGDTNEIIDGNNSHIVCVKPTSVIVKKENNETFIDKEIKERLKDSFNS